MKTRISQPSQTVYSLPDDSRYPHSQWSRGFGDVAETLTIEGVGH